MTNLLISGNTKQTGGPVTDHQLGQQLHVSGVFIVLLELALAVENLFPVFVVFMWMTSRNVVDKIVAAFSIVCILSAIVPAPLGLVSYFSGGWYGGTPTCTTYQVTSLWCNLTSLALLTYICVCCCASVKHLNRDSTSGRRHGRTTALRESHVTPMSVRQRLVSDTTDDPDDLTSMANVNVVTPVKYEPPHQTSAEPESNPGLTNKDNSSEISGTCTQITPAYTEITNKYDTTEPASRTSLADGIDSNHPPHNKPRRNFSTSPPDTHSYVQIDTVPHPDLSWSRSCRPKDYVTLSLFFIFFLTMMVASLPVIGLGPTTDQSQTSCRSWLVPIPTQDREKIFFVVFIVFLAVCLLLGSTTGVSVCWQVSDRMRRERKRKSRLYHEEENVPDLEELSSLDVMKRHYSLTCIVVAGQLTWLPLLLMMILQKSGVEVSEATLMYSNIVTSLPGLLNPLLYSLALSNYRAGYKDVLNKCCCSKHRKGGAIRQSSDTTVDIDVNVSLHGHECLHGRHNPCGAHSISSLDCDEDYDLDAADDEVTTEVVSRNLNEKTPLQVPLDMKQSKLVISPGLSKCSGDLHQSTDRLLSTVDSDDETGL